jgi:hypothetical protein
MTKSIEIALGGVLILIGSGQVGASDLGPNNGAVRRAEQRPPRVAASDATHEEGPRVRCPRQVPAALNPPADATLAAGFPARGVQIYVCSTPASAAPGSSPTWTLKAPHALLSKDGETAAIHFAGPGWHALDGSLVTGSKTASAPAADGSSIPQLLLKAATSAGPGLFADTTWIQRLETVGGTAPATGCDAAHLNAQMLVPYRAEYFFYRVAPSGKHVHQCAGTP